MLTLLLYCQQRSCSKWKETKTKDNAIKFQWDAHASNSILFPKQEQKESKEKTLNQLILVLPILVQYKDLESRREE